MRKLKQSDLDQSLTFQNVSTCKVSLLYVVGLPGRDGLPCIMGEVGRSGDSDPRMKVDSGFPGQDGIEMVYNRTLHVV